MAEGVPPASADNEGDTLMEAAAAADLETIEDEAGIVDLEDHAAQTHIIPEMPELPAAGAQRLPCLWIPAQLKK